MTKSMRVEDQMTDYPSVATAEMGVTEAYELMKKTGIRHLPVLNQQKIVGVVSDRDLRQAQLLADAMSLVVSDVMTPDPYCVYVGTSLGQVASEMTIHKYGCVVVLNRLDRVVGIFTTTDGMRVLSELLDQEKAPTLRVIEIEKLLTRPGSERLQPEG